MKELTGKTLIFTDLHCGLAGNRLSRLNICVNVIKEIVKAIKDNNIQNVIFGGDWYHSRVTLDVNTINIAFKLIQALSKYAKLYLICGNHDSFLKNSTDVNSLNMFRDTPNVYVIDKPEAIIINSQKCLLVPWLTDLSEYAENSFDMMIGHFEISSKYLMQSYIEEHSAKACASKDLAVMIESDSLINGSNNPVRKSESLIGNFVDLVKSGGTIYAGHIHQHKEFMARNRKFIFVGSPYQQTLGEIDSDCGYYILDTDNKPEFVCVKSAPKHIKVMMSQAVSGKFDFSVITGNIIQKIYDIDVQPKDESIVNQKINDFKPYEELLADYIVSISEQNSNTGTNESIELIRKSKLEYIRKYIDSIDKKALTEQNINRDKLFNILESYYAKITGEQQ